MTDLQARVDKLEALLGELCAAIEAHSNPVWSTESRLHLQILRGRPKCGFLSVREHFEDGKPDWRLIRIIPKQEIIISCHGSDRKSAEAAFHAAEAAAQPPPLEHTAARIKQELADDVARRSGA